MPMADGAALIRHAFEAEADEKLYQRWVGMAQYEMSFEEFKRKLTPVSARFKTDEEVFADVENILSAMR